MKRSEFDALIRYINVRANYAAGRTNADLVVVTLAEVEKICVTEEDTPKGEPDA